jgi:hypothetical protein
MERISKVPKLYLSWIGDRLTREFADVKMKWKFNPPAAPHFGGVWETTDKNC